MDNIAFLYEDQHRADARLMNKAQLVDALVEEYQRHYPEQRFTIMLLVGLTQEHNSEITLAGYRMQRDWTVAVANGGGNAEETNV